MPLIFSSPRFRCALCFLGPLQAWTALSMVVAVFLLFFFCCAPPLSLPFGVLRPWVPWALASCCPPAQPPFFVFIPSPPLVCFSFFFAFLFLVVVFSFLLYCASCALPGWWGLCFLGCGPVVVCVAVRVVPWRGPVCACAVSSRGLWLCLFAVCCCLSCCAWPVVLCWRRSPFLCCLWCPAWVLCPLVLFCGACGLSLPLGAVLGLFCCARSCCAVPPCLGLCCVVSLVWCFAPLWGAVWHCPLPSPAPPPRDLRCLFFCFFRGVCWLCCLPPPPLAGFGAMCCVLSCVVSFGAAVCGVLCVLPGAVCCACVGLGSCALLSSAVLCGVLLCSAVVCCCVLCLFFFSGRLPFPGASCVVLCCRACVVALCAVLSRHSGAGWCCVLLPVVFACLLLGLAALCGLLGAAGVVFPVVLSLSGRVAGRCVVWCGVSLCSAALCCVLSRCTVVWWCAVVLCCVVVSLPVPVVCFLPLRVCCVCSGVSCCAFPVLSALDGAVLP